MKTAILKITLYGALVFLVSCAADQTAEEAPELVKKLYFNNQTPYRTDTYIKPEIVDQCEIQKNIVESIHATASKNGLPISAAIQERQLSVQIINATPGLFIFGNMGSIPATLDVKITVTEGKQVLLEEIKSCYTNLAGFMGLQPSACNKLEKCARKHGKYIAQRIAHTLYD